MSFQLHAETGGSGRVHVFKNRALGEQEKKEGQVEGDPCKLLTLEERMAQRCVTVSGSRQEKPTATSECNSYNNHPYLKI